MILPFKDFIMNPINERSKAFDLASEVAGMRIEHSLISSTYCFNDN